MYGRTVPSIQNIHHIDTWWMLNWWIRRYFQLEWCVQSNSTAVSCFVFRSLLVHCFGTTNCDCLLVGLFCVSFVSFVSLCVGSRMVCLLILPFLFVVFTFCVLFVPSATECHPGWERRDTRTEKEETRPQTGWEGGRRRRRRRRRDTMFVGLNVERSTIAYCTVPCKSYLISTTTTTSEYY